MNPVSVKCTVPKQEPCSKVHVLLKFKLAARAPLNHLMTLGPLAVTRVSAPKKGKTATVIFLHGLGDSGDGWSFLPSEVYKSPSLQHIDFVFPNAPLRPVTAFGETVPAWFDVYGFDGSKGSDNEGLFAALETILELIDAEIKNGTPADRIAIGGFSQGAVLTEGLSFICKHKLAGFFPISGYFPTSKELVAKGPSSNLDTPMLMLHGTADQVVPFKMGKKSYDALSGERFGYTAVEWKPYEGLAHSLSLEGLDDIIEFLGRILPNN